MKIIKKESDSAYNDNVNLFNSVLDDIGKEGLSDIKETLEEDILTDLNTAEIDQIIRRDANLKKDWGFYEGNLYNYLFVKNIKYRGIPDFDKVLEELLNRISKKNPLITIDDIENIVSQDYLENEFYLAILDSIIQELESNYDNFVITGRSGGYWGVRDKYI